MWRGSGAAGSVPPDIFRFLGRRRLLPAGNCTCAGGPSQCARRRKSQKKEYRSPTSQRTMDNAERGRKRTRRKGRGWRVRGIPENGGSGSCCVPFFLFFFFFFVRRRETGTGPNRDKTPTRDTFPLSALPKIELGNCMGGGGQPSTGAPSTGPLFSRRRGNERGVGG